MAEMIPDRLPSRASKGEERVFALLKKLPDDCIVYYEPVIRDRYPDFVVILPNLGLLVIEAKGWRVNQIVKADTEEITIGIEGNRVEVQKHPSRQAREYMLALMDEARQHEESNLLLQNGGQWQGRFIFPFAHLVVMNNLTCEQLEKAKANDMRAIFPEKHVWLREDLLEMENATSDKIIERLKKSFDPWWSFGVLTTKQQDILRSVIHPEVIINPHSQPVLEISSELADLKILDLRQERNARSVGDGHRIIYGVAGSGKTVILIARAKLLAENNELRILVLCYNKMLAEYFKHVFSEIPNVRALHFHDWGGKQGVRYIPDEERADYGNRLLKRMERNEGDAGLFDAVMIDEAQDFEDTWFMCAKLALKDPEDGDLLIVCDGNQSLYKCKRFTWKDAGIKARGRTFSLKFDLDRNYRNTRQILLCAQRFTKVTVPNNEDEDTAILSMAVDARSSIRTGPWPEVLTAINAKAECDAVVDMIKNWLEKGFELPSGERLLVKSSDIAILYPRLQKQRSTLMKQFLDQLSNLAPITWLNASCNDEYYLRKEGIVVQTIHSAKGLQYKVVIVMWSDLLPRSFGAEDVVLDMGLFYVALTRAEDILVITHSKESEFTRQFKNALNDAKRKEKPM
jgi:hypothetical protein